ncbi:MAG: SUMF1/EgtB/PvdO family nonheme iron enzyme [Planctomycetes bacterium]|nr:SUMF1/EgtB/PvdO family nonheme iron enzyme [Planctomycetota bacterium]
MSRGFRTEPLPSGDDELPAGISEALAGLLDEPEEHFAAGVAQLCAAHPRHQATLERMAMLWRALPASPLRIDHELRSGDRLGPYRLEHAVGSGGMGSVWSARHEALGLRVAMKFLKPGLDSVQLLRRFRAEQVALARLAHENVARVHDAGVTTSGRPFLVMEFVDGAPITSWCEQRGLGLEARVALFLQVCAGVEHAHQKGLVHRDLSANNVLVTEHGGAALVKVIDFGLARVLRSEPLGPGPDSRDLTLAGTVLGTLGYLAPEQAGGTATSGGGGVDTRADVYALGALLYELLAGCLPFPRETLAAEGLAGLARFLADHEPPRMSARLRALDDAERAAIAAARGVSPTALVARLADELDWITLRCLAAERERRYQAVLELAADLRRHLAREPVLARRPSLGYRLKKGLRRHRGPVIAGGLVLGALVAGLIVSLHYLDLATARAAVIGAQNEEIGRRIREFDQLAGLVRLEEAEAGAERLWPAWPERLPELERWLTESGEPLLAMHATVREALANLRARALPPRAEDLAKDAAEHPRAAELRSRRARHAELTRVRARVTAGGQPQVAAERAALPAALRTQNPSDLQRWAFARVRFDLDKRGADGVDEALLAVRVALADAPADDRALRARILTTLGCAEFAAGRPAAARAAFDDAVAISPPDRVYSPLEQRATFETLLPFVDGDAADAKLAAEASALDALAAEVAARRRFEFASPSDRFLGEALGRLDAGLAALPALVDDVRARRAFAARLAALPADSHAAAWQAARDDLRARNATHELRPQVGLVPLGVDPRSGRHEFYDLASAADFTRIPARNARGELELAAESGIVFVLLEGGSALIGAQPTDPGAPRHDPDAKGTEAPVHRVELAPFLIAKHELTQAQWLRLMPGANPSYFAAGRGYRGSHGLTPWTTPVENVTWRDGVELARRHGYALPTEAQWEYACRAGDDRPLPFPRDAAGQHGNFWDRSGAASIQMDLVPEPFDDGHAGPAPIGSFAPNAFGLSDMHGNVWEWTADTYETYSLPVRAGDGLRQQRPEQADRVLRGGSYGDPLVNARASMRTQADAGWRGTNSGLRVVRPLTP